MSFFYLTADSIGQQSGGGKVTEQESTALFDLAMEQGEECHIWGRQQLVRGIEAYGPEPWCWDKQLLESINFREDIQLAHFYAGTFSALIQTLKRRTKISYTAAAHSVDLSEREHTRLGLPFNYPHLTDPNLWNCYVDGYRNADVVICPSQHSAECMRRYGCERIKVIPHGTDVPEQVLPPPQKFVLGYLGAVGPDKGLIYLLRAWKKLNYNDALLILAGRDSTSDFVQSLIYRVYREEEPLILASGGNKIFRGVQVPPHETIQLIGWVPRVDSFYQAISLYVQPSVTEGFGIEVLEAMAHARPVLCSTGAGAADVVPETWRFPAADVDALAEKIDQFRKADLGLMGKVSRELAREYEWQYIRKRYQKVWRNLP